MSAIREFLKYGMYGKSSWYIAYCPLYGRCPLFGVSAKRGSTVCQFFYLEGVAFCRAFLGGGIYAGGGLARNAFIKGYERKLLDGFFID